MRNIILISLCVLRIQFGWAQTTVPPSVNGTNSTSNFTTNYTLTIIEKKLPDFLTPEQIIKLNLTFNWTEAYNRTQPIFNDSESYIQNFLPLDIKQLLKDSTATFKCPRKNSTIDNNSTSTSNNATNFPNQTSWRIIDLVEPNIKIVTKLNSEKGTNDTLNIDHVTAGDDGYYMCILHDDEEIMEARAALLTVYEPPSSSKVILYTVISIITFLILSILLGGGLTIRYRKQKALLLSRANNAEAFKNWIKTVIIEKDSDMKDMLKSPVVRIELNKRAKHGYAENVEYELPLDTEWEFSRDRLNLGEGLGEGEFGKVLKAEAYGITDPEVWTTVAVKMLKESHTDEEMKGLVAEVEIMKMIGKHKNVLSLLGCSSQNGPLLVITEFAFHGCLKDFLRKCNSSSRNSMASENGMVMDNKTLITFSRQIAEGMEYLASIKCVHRDLAARNVLVTEEYVMKVADFGLARDIQNNEYYRKKSSGKLPVRWMSPEALFQRLYTCKSDIWSFGILLWEIMTLGGIPYPSVPGVEKLFQILREGYRMESPPNCPAKLYLLMRECWQDDPKERPGFDEIIKILDEILADNKDLDFIPSPVPSIPSSTEKVYPSSDESDDSDEDNNHKNDAQIPEKYALMKDHLSQKSSNPSEKFSCLQRHSFTISEGNEYTSVNKL